VFGSFLVIQGIDSKLHVKIRLMYEVQKSTSMQEVSWIEVTHLHDATCKNIGLWTSCNKFADAKHRPLMLICIEQCNGLKTVTKQEYARRH